MTLKRQELVPAALFALSFLVPCPAAHAISTLEITNVYNWTYTDGLGDSITPGPYLGTVDLTRGLLLYCMDLHIDTPINQRFSGTLSRPATQAQEEAAFLAAYSLSHGAPSTSPGIVGSIEGPISMAIWQLMGTLGPTRQDPAAQAYIALAQNAYASGQITPAFLSTVSIWTPSAGTNVQRFLVLSPAPEPATYLLMGAGLMWLARRHRRRGRTPDGAQIS
jgi:hypothetical protein